MRGVLRLHASFARTRRFSLDSEHPFAYYIRTNIPANI